MVAVHVISIGLVDDSDALRIDSVDLSARITVNSSDRQTSLARLAISNRR